MAEAPLRKKRTKWVAMVSDPSPVRRKPRSAAVVLSQPLPKMEWNNQPSVVERNREGEKIYIQDLSKPVKDRRLIGSDGHRVFRVFNDNGLHYDVPRNDTNLPIDAYKQEAEKYEKERGYGPYKNGYKCDCDQKNREFESNKKEEPQRSIIVSIFLPKKKEKYGPPCKECGICLPRALLKERTKNSKSTDSSASNGDKVATSTDYSSKISTSTDCAGKLTTSKVFTSKVSTSKVSTSKVSTSKVSTSKVSTRNVLTSENKFHSVNNNHSVT